MKRNEEMQRYAEVLIKTGAALQKGQALCVEAPVEQSEFVTILAKQAYQEGCSEVGVIWHNGQMEEMAAEYGAFSKSGQVLAEYYADKGAAYIRLDVPSFHEYNDSKTEVLQRKAREDGIVRETFRRKSGGFGQTIACLPGQAWADRVFPELQEQERMDALWEAILLCTRCKEKDPVGAWKVYQQNTIRRKKLLDAMGFIKFHYSDGKTDLWVEPAEKDFWKGGCIPGPKGLSTPNIPTEEVFVTPHKYKVNGCVYATMPLNYKGQIIDGIYLKLQEGRIVEYTAKQGEELLASIIETDEGSHYLGEMAIVDQSSPIAKTGRIFHTTLYDENASCHIAIGNALGPVRDPQERERRGMNTSGVHVDFMIGSEELNIDGQLPDQTWISVLRNGHWAPKLC